MMQEDDLPKEAIRKCRENVFETEDGSPVDSADAFELYTGALICIRCAATSLSDSSRCIQERDACSSNSFCNR